MNEFSIINKNYTITNFSPFPQSMILYYYELVLLIRDLILKHAILWMR